MLLTGYTWPDVHAKEAYATNTERNIYRKLISSEIASQIEVNVIHIIPLD